MPDDAHWLRAASRADLARGGLRVFLGGRWVALLVYQDKVYAIDDRCPHRGSSLAEGIIEDGYISCLEHGWEYSLRDGQGRRPWEGCVETFEVDERAGEVWVKVTVR